MNAAALSCYAVSMLRYHLHSLVDEWSLVECVGG
jgi:hypothetical protein